MRDIVFRRSHKKNNLVPTLLSVKVRSNTALVTSNVGTANARKISVAPVIFVVIRLTPDSAESACEESLMNETVSTFVCATNAKRYSLSVSVHACLHRRERDL